MKNTDYSILPVLFFKSYFEIVYMVCIYLGNPTTLIFYYPTAKNQQTNATYNMAVQDNKCYISYHGNIIQYYSMCFVFGTLLIITDPESVSRLPSGQGG